MGNLLSPGSAEAAQFKYADLQPSFVVASVFFRLRLIPVGKTPHEDPASFLQPWFRLSCDRLNRRRKAQV
jgi:hypothetical protein